MASSLIRGKYVVCKVFDRQHADVIEDGAVFQENGLIVSVGRYSELSRRHRADEVLGSSNHVVIPGFVNSHHHVGLTPLQLGSQDLPLELWFASRMAARDVDVYLDTLYSAFEMVESGITTVQHLHGRSPGPVERIQSAAQSVLRAYQEIGMRVSYSFVIRDQNRLVYESDEEFVRRLPARSGPRSESCCADKPFHWRITSSFSMSQERVSERSPCPHPTCTGKPNWCSDRALEMVRDACEQHDVPFHMHLVETQYQKEYARRRTGGTALRHLGRLGLLGPHCTLGHGVWLSESDIDLVAETGTQICHNCSSNLRLRSGVAALNEFERRGVRVAIGLDEAGINDDRDMLQELRMVLRIHRVPGMDDAVPTAQQVFRMATEYGATTTSFRDSIGTLEPGKAADLCLLNWRQIAAPYLDEDVPVVDAIVPAPKVAE